MINLKMDAAKQLFFDNPAVMAAVDEAKLKSLSRAGAFIQKTAMGLIRSPGKKGNASKPGSPPKNRTGLLRDKIMFVYDPSSKSVVIGPVKINSPSVSLEDGDSVPTWGRTVPKLLEFGGVYKTKEIRVVTQKNRGKKTKFKTDWVRHRQRIAAANPDAQTRIHMTTIGKRPFMAPALAKNTDKITKQVANEIDKSFARSKKKNA